MVSWADARPALSSVRRAVFVEEQQIPESEEWDDFDAVSLHALAIDTAGHAIGTGRLLPDGHIGRMAVRAGWRGTGVGRAVLRALVAAAVERGDRELVLHAQVTAVGFYRKEGFEVFGEPFDEVGIPHRAMRRRLRD